MKKQIFLVLLATLASTHVSHAMQQAAHSARRNIRASVQRRVSANGEEFSKITGTSTLVRCTRENGNGIEQCVEETWVPGLLPALLRLAKQPKSPDLFHQFKQEYHAGQKGE